MNALDRAVRDKLTAGGFAAHFGVAADGIPCPLVVLDVDDDTRVTALGGVGGSTVVTYRLRAVTAPSDATAGDVAASAAQYLVQNPPPGTVVVPVPQAGRVRFVDDDGFYNAVALVTVYAAWTY